MESHMEPPIAPKLLQQAEKILLHPIHSHLISYCPTMDLLAVVTDEENLDVYRINGQRAFSVKRKNTRVKVDAICWKFNGQSIAVAWDDGFVDIVSAETGKVLLKDFGTSLAGTSGTDGGKKGRVACLGWGVNFIDVESVKRRTSDLANKAKQGQGKGRTIDFQDDKTTDWDAFRDNTVLEDFLQRQPDLSNLEIAPNLPDQLATLDIENLLPRLPAIPLPPATPFMRPAAQADSGAFSLQAQVDAIFQPNHLKDHNAVDLLVRCMDNGSVHPSIFDSLETIDVKLPHGWRKGRPVLHSSHPYSCSHGLLMELSKSSSAKAQLAFVPLTLGFVQSAGVYLHLIASKTAQLQNLLLYVQQCLQRIRNFWKHSLDLPRKFMMNITETLEEKGQGDLVTNLYHLACTGNCPLLLKEWLVDELTEAGHKRWDNTVSTSLTTLLAILHENLLPALDRCSLVISRLSGLAQFHDSGWIFSEPTTSFSALQTQIQNLRLLSHTALLYATDAKMQFAVFSKWLRYEIDFEATEPGSQSREEMESKDPGVDIAVVLEYIRYGLVSNDLSPYLRPESELEDEQQIALPVSYEDTRKAVELLKQGAKFKEEALCLDHVVKGFRDGCGKLFAEVGAWQEKSTRMGCGAVIEEGEVASVDMRMIFEPSSSTNPDAITTYITTTLPSTSSTITLTRLVHDPLISSFPSSLHSISVTSLSLPRFEVLDAKFADDATLLVLLKDIEREEFSIAMLPYSATADTVPYTALPSRDIQSLTLPCGSPISSLSHPRVEYPAEKLEPYIKHIFEPRFTPLSLIVNGRKDRRVVVVLASDRKHYRVLDLDFRSRREKANGEGESSSESESDVEMGGS